MSRPRDVLVSGPGLDLARFQQGDVAVILGGRVIGSAAVWITCTTNDVGEMGYALHPHHWGHGYATQIAGLLLHVGFEQLRLERVVATCDPENLASARVLEKAGMRYEGLLRGNVVARERWRDSSVYGTLRTDA